MNALHSLSITVFTGMAAAVCTPASTAPETVEEVTSTEVSDSTPPLPGSWRTVAEIDGSTTAPGAPWSQGIWGWEDVRSVDDPEAVDGKALEFTYEPGENSAGTIEVVSWGGPSREIRIDYRIYYPPGFPASEVGYKHFYWGSPDQGRPTAYYTGVSPNGTAGNTNQWAPPQHATPEGRQALGWIAGAWTDRRDGQWTELTIHAIAESSDGAGDGYYGYYLDGDLLLERTDLNWARPGGTLGFDGLHWYGSQNDPYANGATYRVDYLRVQERVGTPGS